MRIRDFFSGSVKNKVSKMNWREKRKRAKRVFKTLKDKGYDAYSWFKKLPYKTRRNFLILAIATYPAVKIVEYTASEIKKNINKEKVVQYNNHSEERVISDAFKYLSDIPQMKSILENLPENMIYVFSEETPGIASFDGINKISIKQNIVNINNPQERLSFYVTLAHELCHADQKKQGLYFDDLSGASFGETFRVAKIMEIDTRLLGVIIENELLKKEEFKTCIPSIDCQYYQLKLQQSGNNVSKTNSDFVLSYWQNLRNDMATDQCFIDNVNNRYFSYMEQAYHHALLMHDPKFGLSSTKRNSPFDVMSTYLSRMNTENLDPELFLQNNFDNTLLTNSFEDGVTVLNHDGSKYLNLAPTDNPFEDKATFFLNNQVDQVFLRNGKTGEMTPLSEESNETPIPRVDDVIHESLQTVPTADTESSRTSQETANLSAQIKTAKKEHSN